MFYLYRRGGGGGRAAEKVGVGAHGARVCRPIKKKGSLEEQLVGGKLPHYTKAATVLIRGRKKGVVYWRRCCVGTPTPGDLQQQQS